MRIQMLAIGSTGDVYPMVALGQELMSRGHVVTVIAFAALQPLVESAGLLFQALPGDAKYYIDNVVRPGASPWSFLSRLERSLKGIIEPLLETVYQSGKNADAMVVTFCGSTCYSIAEKLGIPIFQVYYCPMHENGDYCLPIFRWLSLGQIINRMTYRIAHRMIGRMESRYTHAWLRSNGMHPKRPGFAQDDRVAGKRVTSFYAFSEAIVPRPGEWGDAIHVPGFFQERLKPFDPPESFQSFLRGGEMPIYFGFGSMTSGLIEKNLHCLLSVLAQTGLRAVLSSGWGNLDGLNLPDSIYVIREYIPHDWLFEQVRAVVHHGGAGTTAAGLRAGKPTLITPFGGDQYFWGKRVYRLGCGPKPIPQTKLTSASLLRAVRDLVSIPAYQRQASAIRFALLQERGVHAASDIIEGELGALTRRERVCTGGSPKE